MIEIVKSKVLEGASNNYMNEQMCSAQVGLNTEVDAALNAVIESLGLDPKIEAKKMFPKVKFVSKRNVHSVYYDNGTDEGLLIFQCEFYTESDLGVHKVCVKYKSIEIEHEESN